MGKCPDEDGCGVCETYHGTATLVLVRNSFAAGMPPEYIPAVFEGTNPKLTSVALERHAWRQNWHRWRKKIPGVVVNQDMMTLMYMRRFIDAQGVVSGNSADKALDGIARVNGLDKQTKVIQGNVSFSWEEKMTRDRDNPGILELEDDGIADDDEVIEVETSAQVH